MLAVKEGGVQALHAVEHRLVGVLLGSIEVFLVAKQLIGIQHRLVHAAMLGVKQGVHVAVADLRHDVHTPVGHLAEQLLGHVIVAVEVGIAQTGQYFVLHVEGHPATMTLVGLYVALIEGRPVAVDRLTADEAVEALRILVVLILTVLQHADHVVHALLQLRFHAGIVAGSVGQGQGREVMAAHMTAQVKRRVAPVREVRMLRQPLVVAAARVRGRCQTRLTYIRRQQSVNVILQQHLDILVHGRLHRAVKQCHLFQIEMFGIKLRLCRQHHGTRYGSCRKHESQFHIVLLF